MSSFAGSVQTWMGLLYLELAFGCHPVKIVDPVTFQQINEENNRTEDPCDGVGPGDSCQCIDEPQRHRHISHPEQAPAGQQSKHRNGGFSGTAQNGG